MGSVSIMPINAETMAPIGPGCSSVAFIITIPIPVIIALTVGPASFATAIPAIMVPEGVAIMSIFVSLDMILPASDATTAPRNAPTGPPHVLPAKPTATQENTTIGGAFRACAIATAMAAPVMELARPPNSTRIGIPAFVPIVLRISPVISDEKRPTPIAPRASTK